MEVYLNTIEFSEFEYGVIFKGTGLKFQWLVGNPLRFFTETFKHAGITFVK